MQVTPLVLTRVLVAPASVKDRGAGYSLLLSKRVGSDYLVWRGAS